MLQNTLCFIICELLTDGDRRLTDFHYVLVSARGLPKMEGRFKQSVLETQEAFLQTGVPYSATRRRKLTLSFLKL